MIECRNLVRDFGEFRAVDGVSFHVPRGKICALLGPNGAGKSTIMKMLAGLLAPTAGTVSVDALDPVKAPLELKRICGILPEGLGLFDDLTVEEHLQLSGPIYGLSAGETSTRGDQLLRLLDLEHGRDTFLSECSHGMRKKTALALALLHNPRVLFLDEPFEGIDPVTSKTIRDLLAAIAGRGITIFLTSHILSIVDRLAGQILMLRKGRIVWNSEISKVRTAAGGFVLRPGGTTAHGRSGMVEVAAVLKALGRVVWRDLRSYNSLIGNNFFLFVLLLAQQLSAGLFFILILGLLLLFPLSADPLAKVPRERLEAWPIARRGRVALRLGSMLLSPAAWITVAVVVKTSSIAAGASFLALAACAQATGVLGARLIARAPQWDALRWIPEFPGRWGGLVSKDLRQMLRVLDFYLALLLSLSGILYRLLGRPADPEAFPILAIMVILALSTYGQCLFGLDWPVDGSATGCYRCEAGRRWPPRMQRSCCWRWRWSPLWTRSPDSPQRWRHWLLAITPRCTRRCRRSAGGSPVAHCFPQDCCRRWPCSGWVWARAATV